MDEAAHVAPRGMREFLGLLGRELGYPYRRGAIAQFSRATGVRANLISRWLSEGMRPTPENLRRIAPALGVTYDDLMRMVYDTIPRTSSIPPSTPDSRAAILRASQLLAEASQLMQDALAVQPVETRRKRPVNTTSRKNKLRASGIVDYLYQIPERVFVDLNDFFIKPQPQQNGHVA